MMIERNEFRIKFGRMREAIALWKEMLEQFKGQKDVPNIRMSTDVTGPAYTLIMEMELRDFIHIGMKTYEWMSNAKVGELYQQFVPLCESSKRTLYKIEFEN